MQDLYTIAKGLAPHGMVTVTKQKGKAMSKSVIDIDSKYLMHIYLEARTSEILDLIEINRRLYVGPETLSKDDVDLISEGCHFVLSSIVDLLDNAEEVMSNIDEEIKGLYEGIKEKNTD